MTTEIPERSETERVAAAFLARTLPKPEWTHHAHLRVGLWHLITYPADEAMSRLRDGIRGYNDATGVANTETSGYHETLTRFYVLVIDAFLTEAGRSRPPDALAEDLIRLYGDRQLPLRFYSKERLMSPQARRGWVDPDLLPAPSPVPGGLTAGSGYRSGDTPSGRAVPGRS